MNDKKITIADLLVSAKRTEFLTEQILCNLVGHRYGSLPLEERKSKIDESLKYVNDDLQEFFQSLEDSQGTEGEGTYSFS